MTARPSLVRELSAAALVPAGVFGFVRVFEQPGAVVPIAGAALLSTFVAAVLRRRNVPLVIAAIASTGLLALVVVLRYAPGTTVLGIVPTSDSWEALEQLARDGIQEFRDRRAPVPDLPPFIAFAMVGAWVMAFLTDWGAQRLRLAFEPVLPGGLLFVFSAVLGSGDRRTMSTLVFAGAVLLWAVVQRTEHVTHSAPWLNSDRRRGPTTIARNASIVALAALLIGTTIGPRLPGADEEELFYWRSRTDPTRTVVSPFVEIGDRLVEQKDTPLFTVTAERPAYWRVAGLDTFDEENAAWSTRLTFENADGPLPGQRNVGGDSVVLTQDITIQNLSAIWLPAAFAPSRIVESDEDVTWNTDTASLAISRGDGDTDRNSDGLNYTVESVLPVFAAEELRAADPFVPAGIAERYLTVPETLSSRVVAEAQQITSEAETNYDRAIALQNYFRQFDYSLSLSPRTDDPIEQFLDERIGFCQQFSGTFAIMARSLGIPTRVAVGFTWGDPIAGQADTYQVTGRHTHAWPEVWFEDFGWVAFEPTPGRGAPDAGSYTGVGEQQDSLVQETLDTPAPESDPADVDPLDPTQDIEDVLPDFQDQGDVAAGGAADESNGPLPGPSWLWIGVLAAALGAAAGPLIHAIRRRRRTARAVSPADRVSALWADAADDLANFFALVRGASETRGEFAARLEKDPRLPPGALANLAQAATAAHYGGPVDHLLVGAESAAAELRSAVRLRTTRVQRWRRLSDPRRWFGPRRRVGVQTVSVA
jgi:transglutaminase-like putative cysteine protease